MRTLKAALVLALAAVPAGAIQLVDVPAPQAVRAALPAVAPALPSSLIAAPAQAAAAPAAAATILPLQPETEAGLSALPSAAPLRSLGVLGAEAPQAAPADAFRFSAGFDGTDGKLLAAPADPSNPGGSGNGFTPGGFGSGSGGGSGSGPKNPALIRLIAQIELTGQVRANPQTGEAFKMIAPKVERTPNGGAMYAVALSGKVDAQGKFTRTGVMAVRQTQESTQTPLSATQTRHQTKETATQVSAGLDGKAADVAGFSSDHTDVVETIKHDVQAKAADFQRELAAAQKLLGATDFKGLVAEISKQGQLDIQGLFSGGGPRVIHELEQSQAPDGTQSHFVAILDLDQKGAPSRLSLIRDTGKGTLKPDGKSNTAREDTTTYAADMNGALVEAVTIGKDHSLDVQESKGPADAAAQTDFDAIVAKVSQP